MLAPVKNQIAATLARIGIAGTAEGVQEFSENVTHDAIVKVLVDPNAKIDFGQSVEEGGVGAAVGGIVRSIVEGALHIRNRGARAEQDSALLENLTKLARESKTLPRDPEMFQQFIAQAAEDGPVTHVYIDGQTLMQSGIAEQVAAVSPSVAAQLPVAAATGGQVSIPIEEYTARIAPTEYSQPLLDHLKTDPDGGSRAEAREYMQSEAGAALEAAVNRAAQTAEQREAMRERADRVKARVLEDLDAAGRFSPTVNEAYATVFSAYYTTRAAQLGVEPEALYERRRVNFAAQQANAAQQFEQRERTTIEAETARWHKQIDRLGRATSDFRLDLDVPTVLRSLGSRAGGLRVTAGGVEHAMNGHPDVPQAVWRNLPEMIARPQYAFRNGKNESWNVVPHIKSAAGEHVVIAFDEQGTLSTVYVLNNDENGSSDERLATMLAAAMRNNDRVYAENGLPEGIRASVKTLTPTPARSGANSRPALPRPLAKVVTRDGLVNRFGEDFYQGNADPDGEALSSVEEDALKRGKPVGKIEFKTPITGPSGARVIAYQWQWKWGTEVDGLGEANDRRVSDWELSQESDDTGREIVHQFAVKMPDGAERMVSVESAARLLGFESVSASGIPVASVKTIARLHMEHARAQAVADEYTGALTALLRADANNLNYPDYIATYLDREPVFRDIRRNWKNLNRDGFARRKIPELNRLTAPHTSITLKEAQEALEESERLEKRIKSKTGAFSNTDDNILHQGARGAFSPETLTISMLEGADLSTVLHEGGHFFFENDLFLALDILTRGTPPTASEQQLLTDISTLLQQHGIQGEIGAQLEQWTRLPFEEKRAYHEATAEMFERYLFSGKAPSIELQSYFRKFRAWLLNVYRGIKEFIAGHPAAGKLDAEVRAVFDRMLASEEEIALAGQARSMMPLFESPEQAGMTPEAFADYQALYGEATQAAVETLQARGLRDMKWLRNARAKALKNIQKEARWLRDGVMMDVRTEVMRQPVYRAWAFLTGRMGKDDALPPLEKPKSASRYVDPQVDSLFVAIAKLGGLNRAQVENQWGVGKKEKIPILLFGKPVLRRNGGLLIDDMAAQLSQYGYLTLDANNQHDNREFEDFFGEELRGNPQFSTNYDYEANRDVRPGDQVVNPEAVNAGRLDRDALAAMGLDQSVVNVLKARRMTADNGFHPDIVAELIQDEAGNPLFSSGDEMVQALAAVEPPGEVIEAMTDARMLEDHGDLATPESIEAAADEAIHNAARARFVATEANALAEAVGKKKLLREAAREFAARTIDGLRARDLQPGQYARAAARAGANAAIASGKGDLARAAAEKRNQALQLELALAAREAQRQMRDGLRYLRLFTGRRRPKGIQADANDLIDTLLARVDLKTPSNAAADFDTWLQKKLEEGFLPDIDPRFKSDAMRKPWRNMTMEELRGLTQTVREIAYIGRKNQKLLTDAKRRDAARVRKEVAAHILANWRGTLDVESAITRAEKDLGYYRRNFMAAHLRVQSIINVLDGGKLGGPLWEALGRPANAAADRETLMNAEATQRLSSILDPIMPIIRRPGQIAGRMSGKRTGVTGTLKGKFYPALGRAFTPEERFALILNLGNESNIQRVLDGAAALPGRNGQPWTMDSLAPVFADVSAAEWLAAQQVWDFFESYRPMIAEKERRLYGREPEWIEPRPFTVTTGDGQTLDLRGGYYPVRYDPAGSVAGRDSTLAEQAESQLRGPYTSATTRRTFTKTRVDVVRGRPVLFTLSGLYSNATDVVHDLCWHEWLIDANRLLKPPEISSAIRQTLGNEVYDNLRKWVDLNAEGDRGVTMNFDRIVNPIRRYSSASGLAFNVTSSLLQPLGYIQSIKVVGAQWVKAGVARGAADFRGLAADVNSRSTFMANRARTQFRELNEIRNTIAGQSAPRQWLEKYSYWMMTHMQQLVDYPTWWGQFLRAQAQGRDDATAAAMADQAVINSQGSGLSTDLSTLERNRYTKIFTVFYNFMGTNLNLMWATAKTARTKGEMAAGLLWLSIPGVILERLLREITRIDDDDWALEDWAARFAKDELAFLLGSFVFLREIQNTAEFLPFGDATRFPYEGPPGLRLIPATYNAVEQAFQGEFDEAFLRTSINLSGALSGLPSAQINKTISGARAIGEGRADNPAEAAAALIFGAARGL
ncbi:MAG: hypothetical protein LBF61_02465 [Azoarcus sp.]|nr:hypothetical protein [Azoarcus sp.]